MGFFRKGGLGFFCVIAFILLLISGILLTLSLSLRYENIQNELVPVAKEIAIDEINIEDKLKADFDLVMTAYCQNYDEFVFNEQGYTFVIPCSIIANGSDAVIEYGVDAFVKEIYYKNYECDFWGCFGDSEYPTFLVSEKAQDYWTGKFYLSILIFIVFAGLMYFLVESKINLMIIIGILFIVAALPFLAISKILSFFVEQTYLELFTAFFSSSHSVFLISLILGIILLGLGILLKIKGTEMFTAKKPAGKKK